MQNRRFGRLGWQVSEVGYGMWGVGAGEGGWVGADESESMAALQLAVDNGCTFFDTAWIYGRGQSEVLLGKLIRANPGVRLHTATKIPPKDRNFPSTRDSKALDVFPADYSFEYARKSLANLGLDQVDLLQFHVWEDSWLADDEFLESVQKVRDSGVARAIGISMNRWEPWNGVQAVRSGIIDSVQVIYNIFDQSPEDTLFPACRENDVAVIARVPFDEGTLTGSINRQSTWPEGDWRNSYFVPENLESSVSRVEALQHDLGEGTPLPSLALRFILQNPDVSTVIPGMRQRRHVNQNLDSSGAEPLPAEVMQTLRRHRWDRTPTEWSQ